MNIRPFAVLGVLAALASPAHAAFTIDFTAGALSVTAVNEPVVALGCNAGQVAINGENIAATVACAAVATITINGDALDNSINLSATTAADFPALTGTSLFGQAGNDLIIGSFAPDLIEGGIGNDTLDGHDNPPASVDTVKGGDGDDRMFWNPGKDDDVNIGGAGNDTALIVGGGGGEVFFIREQPTASGTVRFERTTLNGNPAPFFVDITETEVLRLDANGGNDSVDANTLRAGLIALELNGTDGDDTIVGSQGADLIDGGIGNDTLDGHDNPLASVDTVKGGDGDDQMIWNPGKDDDINIGGAGNDTALIVGGGGGEVFFIREQPTASGTVRFERTTLNGNPAPFFVDVTETELLRLNANAGNDSVDANTLRAGLIALELNGGDGDDTIVGSQGADLIDGGIGNDTLDGHDNPLASVDTVKGGDGDDQMIWNPGKDDDINIGGAGNDTALIVGGGGGEVFFIREQPTASGTVRFERTTLNGNPAPFFVDITETELLRLNANGGNDSVEATTLRAGLIALELNGGDNDDTIVGSFGLDVLNGGPGNDSLRAGGNPVVTVERMDGGPGDDHLIWNPGDGDDFNEGGLDNDTLLVNAAGASEHFRISEIGPRFLFVRLQPTVFTLESAGMERLQLNATAGDDLVETQPLAGVQQQLDGGPQSTALGDRLRVSGIAATPNSPILTPGFGAIAHSNFESTESTRSGGSFSARLDGAQEVPPVTTSATGRGTVQLNADETEISVRLNFTGLSSASTVAHIHGPAPAGSNAPPIFNLTGLGGTAAQLGPFVVAVTPQQVSDLKAGLWYFNVHSQNHPAGEIRGQIRLDRSFDGPLSGRQVVPRAETLAGGYVTARLDGALDQVFITLSYAGLTGEGVPGTSVDVGIFGPAQRGNVGARIATITLPVSGLASDQIVAGPFAITAAQAQQLIDGLWYAQVASAEFPEGEIRGQITDAMFFDNFE